MFIILYGFDTWDLLFLSKILIPLHIGTFVNIQELHVCIIPAVIHFDLLALTVYVMLLVGVTLYLPAVVEIVEI